ncbi:Clp protease [Hyphomicrobium sp.]|jgi:hypothetical protein|uniref:Clp protease n=1 Tax=Hyphomicrobium sp. TaxID=82 RepID=UPI003561F2D9
MAYHGEDLDLRTPQTWASAPADVIPPGETAFANGKRGTFVTGPVLVDETVLACFNQAYDIASAHRAGEVRVEHLLNAMTRLDAAAAALEMHAVRVIALKRETATIIAGDIPAVPGNGAVSPRRSEELADVLKFATAFAARRNAAVTIDDILQVLFDHRQDFTASELLLRFASRVAEPLPPLTRAEPRYAPAAAPRYSVDYARPAYRTEYLNTPTDSLQNSRIEALEQSVRALGHDLSNERHAIAGIVRDLARDTVAHQDDQGRTHSILIDRLGSLESAFRDGGVPSSGEPSALIAKLGDIEAGLELRLQEMSQSWLVLSARLQELEASIRERPVPMEGGAALDDIRQAVDLKPIADRLDVIEEAVLGGDQRGFVELGDRLARLEDGIGLVLASPAGDGRRDDTIGGFDKIEGLSGSLDGLSGKFDTHYGSLSELVINLAERVSGAERAITAEIETAAAKHQAYTQDLTEVHEALLKVNQNQHTLAGSMDQARTDSANDVASIINRLAALDRDTALPAETLGALNTHMDAMNRFIIERYHRRHRFMYWLFGTDDWMSASWPSTRATIETDQHRLKVVGQTES